MSRPIFKLAGACLLALATGCVAPSQTTYEWAGYQRSVMDFATQPGGVDVAVHIARLSVSRERSLQVGRPLPPGFQAHLGYLLLLQGSFDLAQTAFDSEMQSYPESRAFLAGLLARLEDPQ